FPNVPNPSVIIASGGAIPDPAVQGFVLQVFDFKSGDYERAIAAKVKAIVRPPAVPVPAAVWLFGTALLGFIGVSRRRKVA
ncbi:MAG: PEP-CTERM sorting domain-containing protein, partial [Gammaproteobacteria bacterium]